MKKTFTFIAVFFLAIGIKTKAQYINYQGVARDNTGNILNNQPIALRLSILSGSAVGTSVYVETHAKTTDAYGLFNLQIGQGTLVSGVFNNIAWSSSSFFLKVEIDPTGGTNYGLAGTTQFSAVPFALNAKNGTPNGQNPGDMLYWNGTQWLNVPAGSNGQVLVFNNGIPVWGGTQLPHVNAVHFYYKGACKIWANTDAIPNDGGSPIITWGACYGTTPQPTVLNNTISFVPSNSTLLAFINNLVPSTHYYFRSFATNSIGTSYGAGFDTTTQSGVINLSTAIGTIEALSASVNGIIVNDSGGYPDEKGICYNTSPNPTLSDFSVIYSGNESSYSVPITGLTAATTYYARSYATNCAGTFYGNEINFTTQDGVISLTTNAVTAIANHSATSGGNIISDGGAPVTVRGICFATTAGPTTANTTVSSGSGTGSFVANLTGLSQNTSYFVRAYATNGTGTYYGGQQSFTTQNFLCGTSLTINHVTTGGVSPVDKTTTYNTVTNIPGEPVKCWISKNLGATNQATSANDATEAAAGWYWQFNKKQGYKHDGTTRTPATTWITTISENSDWLAANDPCALELGSGWRLPTSTEWTNVDASGSWTSWAGPYGSGLKLHASGYLSTSGLSNRGSSGNYWSGTEDYASAGWYLTFTSGTSSVIYNTKANGLTARCLID